MRTSVILLALGIGAAGAWGQALLSLDLGAIQPVSLVAADFNRDGFPDLAVACHSSNAVVLFENTKAPLASFKDKVQWILEDAPVALAVGSFMDPACAAAPACLPYTSVFPNLVAVTQYQPGLVRFTPVEAKAPFLKLVSGGPVKVEVLPFTTLTHLVLGDFDNDGTTDVAVLDGISMKVGFYLGERAKLIPAVPAQGCAGKPPAYLLEFAGRDLYFLGASDFDRDGLLDLVVSMDGLLLFFRNETGEGKLKFVQKAEIKLGTKLKAFTLADFNRDGYGDLAVVDPEFGALTVVMNRGCWRFERGQRLKFDGGPWAVVAADFDRNGLPDLVVAEKDANRVTLLINELSELGKTERPDPCAQGPTPPERIDVQFFRIVQTFKVGQMPVALATEDFDRDGMTDLAVALFTENKVQVIYNPALCRNCLGRTPGQALKAESNSASVPNPPLSPAPEKGEGRLKDGPKDGSVAASLQVEEFPSLTLGRTSAQLVAAGDLNGDGKFDLVLADGVSLLFYQGSEGGVLPRGDFYLGFKPDRLLVADLDGNGFGDVLAVSWSTRDMAFLLFGKDFLVSKPIFSGLPRGVQDVLTLQLDGSKAYEIVWLREGGPVVWNLAPQGAFLEWGKVPESLTKLIPRPSELYAFLEMPQGDVLLVHYSNNPGELLFRRGETVIAIVQVPHHAPLLSLCAYDLNGDGVLDLLGLEQGGRVRLWRVRKETP
ncbi:MAG: VCBS repeat-containing protein [Candidatus Bipolaricaulota bacterium]|nr:VCBS repeat-containing protein [Candidatus Bipolaricaulota bacterium]MDW8152233.1 VCBS repeat-containing protein [Candidatus Bipolaricaulota bacterium]